MTLENQLDTTIDKLCNIKTQLKAGNAKGALTALCALESSLHQSLAMLSLENDNQIEYITCDDYPPLLAAI
ncbi:MAG: hypothetical protein ACJAUP_003007 [Cellvibrionaceae bacterium]|jgi:hypothetical protein